MLDELWAALGGDPFVSAECLARPLLAERLLRDAVRSTGFSRVLAEQTNPPEGGTTNATFDQWWSEIKETLGVAVDAPEFAYRLPEMAAVAVPCGGDEWAAMKMTDAPMRH